MEDHAHSNNVQGQPPPATVPRSEDWTLGYLEGYNAGLQASLSSSLQAIQWNRPQSEPVTSLSSQVQMCPQASTLPPCCSGTPIYSMQQGSSNFNTHASGPSQDVQGTEAAAQVFNYRAIPQHGAADSSSTSALIGVSQPDLGTSMVDLGSWDHAATSLEPGTQGELTIERQASEAFIQWNTSFYGDVHPRLYSPSQNQSGLGIAAASRDVPLVSTAGQSEQYGTRQAPSVDAMRSQQGVGHRPLAHGDNSIAVPQVVDCQRKLGRKVSAEETEAPLINTHETIGIPSEIDTQQVSPDSPGDTTRASSPVPSEQEEDDDSDCDNEVPPLEALLASIPGRKRGLSPGGTSEQGHTAKRRATDH